MLTSWEPMSPVPPMTTIFMMGVSSPVPPEGSWMRTTVARVPRRSHPCDTPVGLLGRGDGPVELAQGDRELSPGAHAELGEHLVQVVLDGSGADEELACYLRVRVLLGSQPDDLPLLGGEHVPALGRSFAYRLPGRQQLAAGALGERLGSDAAERLVGEAQVPAPVVAPVPATQPLAVKEV